MNPLTQILIGILTTIVLGLSSWNLIETISHGKVLASMQAHISNVSARIGDLER